MRLGVWVCAGPSPERGTFSGAGMAVRARLRKLMLGFPISFFQLPIMKLFYDSKTCIT